MLRGAAFFIRRVAQAARPAGRGKAKPIPAEFELTKFELAKFELDSLRIRRGRHTTVT
jgi:hypothetical protein